MEYNWKAIGKRIKDERVKLSLSQDQLIEKIGFSSRQLLSRWERGTSTPSLYDLLNLCKIFKCELGYLLCEYDCKTREKTDIHAVTGLSEKSIELLKILKDRRQFIPIIESSKIEKSLIKESLVISPFVISSIIEDVEFWRKFDDLLSSYINAKSMKETENPSKTSDIIDIVVIYKEVVSTFCQSP